MSRFWAMQHGATDVLRGSQELPGRIAELDGRIDKAMLVCEALWTMLRDKLGVSEDELVERVNQVDLSDGELDGKVRRSAVNCPKCSRTIARRFPRCIYCGQPVVHDPFAS